jgi:hypothetical protein
MRETRDLLRRRTYLVRTRAELLTHLQLLNAQYNLAPFPKKLSFAANRAEMNIAARFTDPRVQKSATVNLALIDRLEELWRQEDRQRPPALGLRRAGVSAFAR